MGLSQYRGGMKSDGESSSDEEGGMVRRGAGTKKGQTRKTARKAYEKKGEPMSEAMAMGLHLGKHLHSLHGGKFLDEFGAGMGSARREMMGGASASKTGAYEGGGWFDTFRDQVLPAASSVLGKVGEFVPGLKPYTDVAASAADVANQASQAARKFPARRAQGLLG